LPPFWTQKVDYGVVSCAFSFLISISFLEHEKMVRSSLPSKGGEGGYKKISFQQMNYKGVSSAHFRYPSFLLPCRGESSPYGYFIVFVHWFCNRKELQIHKLLLQNNSAHFILNFEFHSPRLHHYSQ
jgi:hypothetical protein